jgi:flagellar basal-body rod modification protein FlgD
MTSTNPLTGVSSPSAGTDPTASPSSAGSNGLSNPNTFITLLTAQLQAQDPLDPMSPSEMVDQLTQINSLQQLMQIQGDLQSILALSTSASQAGTSQAAPNSVSQANSSTSKTLGINQ